MKMLVETPALILDILQKLSPDSSKNTLKSWIEQGRVSIDGRLSLRWNRRVLKGEEVVIRPKTQLVGGGIKLLFEDAHIVVIEKPVKLLSVASETEFEKTAHNILKRRTKKRVWPVHRLDKDTSGVMMFAYTEEARDILKNKFELHDIEREYHGIVQGILTPPVGTWESSLVEDASYFVKSSGIGKRAITHYTVISQNATVALVKFKLETGRKNQIRVHCSEAGHPIAGDLKYGSTIRFFKRLCLHASLLGFEHPITKKKMSFNASLPTFFRT
jgi:tRNA pseudouridine32 synthase/23S rRNA pseudouridine746 synthase/23S rRNA pseudouridine1911/1915/1917 synthase